MGYFNFITLVHIEMPEINANVGNDFAGTQSLDTMKVDTIKLQKIISSSGLDGGHACSLE